MFRFLDDSNTRSHLRIFALCLIWRALGSIRGWRCASLSLQPISHLCRLSGVDDSELRQRNIAQKHRTLFSIQLLNTRKFHTAESQQKFIQWSRGCLGVHSASLYCSRCALRVNLLRHRFCTCVQTKRVDVDCGLSFSWVHCVIKKKRFKTVFVRISLSTEFVCEECFGTITTDTVRLVSIICAALISSSVRIEKSSTTELSSIESVWSHFDIVTTSKLFTIVKPLPYFGRVKTL